MATDIFGNTVDDPYGVNPPQPPPSVTGAPSSGASGGTSASPLDVEGMIARDTGAWRGMLQNATHGLNFGDPTKAVEEELPGVLNWVRANVGADPRGGVDEAIARLKRRGAPGSATNVPGGGTRPPTAPPGPPAPPNQFTDPYTSYLEDMAKRNIGRLQQSPELTQLMGYLNSEFKRLSESPGFSPDELALLRTQAVEPINAQRDTARRQVWDRISASGQAPSSGLAQALLADLDRAYGQMQTAAQRDVAVQGLNRQQQNRADALSVGQLALQIPNAQDAQALNIAQMLYQLPRNAMNDALAVVNSSSPTSALGPLINLLQLQQQGNQFNTATNQANQQALWAILGQLFGTAFNG